MRDEFSLKVKQQAAMRVGWRCSNPGCRAATTGPGTTEGALTVNVGEAAHIRGASPRGPRFAPQQTSDERTALENAIWLCTVCAKLVDSDVTRFTATILEEWRCDSEELAELELGRPADLPNRALQPARFALIRLATDQCAWWPAWKFRRSPVRFGFHELHQRNWEAAGVTERHVLDPVLDITVANDGGRPLLVHQIGFLPEAVWADIKGLMQPTKVLVLECYELPVGPIIVGERQILELHDPVSVPPEGHFRFTFRLKGYRDALRGNESIVRLAVGSDAGVRHSRRIYLGVY
jgi:hypothetical protein